MRGKPNATSDRERLLLSKLHNLTETLDLYDPSGHRLGRVVPVGGDSQTPTARVEIDANLLRTLRNLADPMELCDPTGRVLATVFPTIEIPDHEPWLVDFTEEDL